MALSNSQYDHLMRTYEQKQLDNEFQLRKRYEKAYALIPELEEMDHSISSLSVKKARLLLDGDQTALSSLKSEIEELSARKPALLKSHGLPANYLEMHYQCPDCKDTGYIGTHKCHCFKKAIIDLLYEQSNLKEILKKENFSNFALDYYSTNFIDPKTGRSSRQVIEDALRICRNFVTSFGTDFQNLFLYGDVGVGKTFLSNCIAKELMDKEYSVLYFSASKFFSSLAKHAFDKQDVDAQNMFELIYNCDCLIIDDLGTEYTNNFIASQFFTCINERLLNSRSTIISTNLSLDTLADLYTERSFSRITSNYIMLKLIGDDIRIKKKLKNREEN